MKIAIAQLDTHIGNFEQNQSKILDAIKSAQMDHADLVVFPELTVCGYPPRDFLDFDDFIDKCDAVINEIRKHTSNIAIVVGSPTRNTSGAGKPLYNSAYVIQNEKIVKVVHKTLLPVYNVFDEYRYFEAGSGDGVVEINGVKLAITICEDIWNVEGNMLYRITPLDEMIKENPELIINISASPFHDQQWEKRAYVIRKNVHKYKIPMFYANQVGAQTELIFDGASLAVSPDGSMFRMAEFEEDLRVFDLEEVKSGNHISQKSVKVEEMELVHKALVIGVKDYFRKLSINDATLGLSGGIDSAVVFALAVEALGADHVHPVMMPSMYSSDHSVSDSKEMCEMLGVTGELVGIENIYKSFESSLEQNFRGLKADVTEENIQARIRGTLVMAFANKYNYVLLNTTNKSEMAVGYGTLYGDLAGGLSVIGDLYKTRVYELAKHLNSIKKVIPQNIIDKEPSAELRPDQLDSDSLPPYAVLDQILYHYIEETLGPKEIKDKGLDPIIVDKVLRLVNLNEYKRYQTCPVLRVTSKAFGMGRRMPIVARYLS